LRKIIQEYSNHPDIYNVQNLNNNPSVKDYVCSKTKLSLQRMKIAIIVGARPNLIKAAPLLREFAQYPEEFEVFLIHTGQHSSFSLSRALLHDLEMPEPDFWLSAGSGSHASQTAAVLIQVEDCLMNLEPDLVLVFGDVNSTMGAAIVANKLGIKVGHIEAGLRCFDSSMPEEVNRLVTDHISDFLFVSEHSGLENLMTERIPTARIFYTGNIMIDSLIWCLKKISNRDIPNGLKLKPGEFGVLTLHRPSNVDSREVLTGIFEALVQIAITLPIIFPCHPRTQNARAYGNKWYFDPDPIEPHQDNRTTKLLRIYKRPEELSRRLY
jgi:UDP-N-acetylglucosamine 2-epimerase (non-hydrolysing)